MIWYLFIHFIPLSYAEWDNYLPFSGASSIPLCYVLFPATLLHQLFFHPLSPHLAISFLVFLLVLLFPDSCIILFWEFCFLPLCSCPNQRNIFNLIVFLIEGFLTVAYISWLVNIFQFSFSLSCTGPKIFYTLYCQKCSIAFCLSLLVSKFLMHTRFK